MKIVAEIGTSHQGSMDKAKALVECAKKCGADIVKFQWVYADEILHPKTGFVQLPTGRIPLYERFKQLEVAPDFFFEIKNFCHEIGIEFMCTPFGPKSLSELYKIDPDYIKIASPELNYVQLLSQLNDLVKFDNKPVVLSTGVSKLSDIETALECFEHSKIKSDGKLTLLHCITQYPAPEEEYNLCVIQNLRNIFGLPTGVSDHSLSPLYIPLLSQALGATMLEKHITLSNETDGLDDPVALNPKNFELMCKIVSDFSAADNILDYTINFLQNKIGDKVGKIIGSGIKELAPSEKANYGRTNRSLRFIVDKKAGDFINEGDIGVLRTEKVLDIGLEPKFLNEFVGKKLQKDVKSSDPVLWNCITE